MQVTLLQETVVQAIAVNKGAGSLHQVVGARLQEFWEAWESRSLDPWVVSVLRDGYQIPFLNHQLPPLSPTPRDFPSYLGDVKKFLAIQGELEM